MQVWVLVDSNSNKVSVLLNNSDVLLVFNKYNNQYIRIPVSKVNIMSSYIDRMSMVNACYQFTYDVFLLDISTELSLKDFIIEINNEFSIKILGYVKSDYNKIENSVFGDEYNEACRNSTVSDSSSFDSDRVISINTQLLNRET